LRFQLFALVVNRPMYLDLVGSFLPASRRQE